MSNYAMENLDVSYIYYGFIIGILVEILSHFF